MRNIGISILNKAFKTIDNPNMINKIPQKRLLKIKFIVLSFLTHSFINFFTYFDKKKFSFSESTKKALYLRNKVFSF